MIPTSGNGLHDSNYSKIRLFPKPAGDLGYVDANHRRFCFDNRIQGVITCRDSRLYPGELERVLAEHRDVADAAVIGIPHLQWGEAPAAFIELKPTAEASEELRRALSDLIESKHRSAFDLLLDSSAAAPLEQQVKSVQWSNVGVFSCPQLSSQRTKLYQAESILSIAYQELIFTKSFGGN